METNMLRSLAVAVFLVICVFTAWAHAYGWDWLAISLFDFWAYTTIFFSSAYLLYEWDERKGRGRIDD